MNANNDLGRKKRVLVLVGYFTPGYRAGGPIRSLSNLTSRLCDRLDFTVVTRAHDLGSRDVYPEALGGSWSNSSGARVRYVNAEWCSPSLLRRLEKERLYDCIYLNSLFDPGYTVMPLLWRYWRLAFAKTPVVLAPRGELFAGALAIKSVKKRWFLNFVKATGLYRRVTWQASNSAEANAIKAEFGNDSKVLIAANMPCVAEVRRVDPEFPDKCPGEAKFVYVARVARNKNLLGAIQACGMSTTPLTLSIFGTIEDQAYWRECQAAIERLPPGIQVAYHGELRPDQVAREICNHDVYLSLTHGENFGHGIAEALLAGVPVLISDQTPWRGLRERRAGWDVALEDRDAIKRAIEAIVAMDRVEYKQWSSGAQGYAAERIKLSQTEQDTLALFAEAIAR